MTVEIFDSLACACQEKGKVEGGLRLRREMGIVKVKVGTPELQDRPGIGIRLVGDTSKIIRQRYGYVLTDREEKAVEEVRSWGMRPIKKEYCCRY